MNYSELKQIFRELKATSPRDDLTAHVIFTEDSFATQYPLLSRTYRFNSDNKGFRPRMFSNSIFAYCLDKTSDQGVRLDWYMAEEGNPDGWEVENCYILERMQDAAADELRRQYCPGLHGQMAFGKGCSGCTHMMAGAGSQEHDFFHGLGFEHGLQDSQPALFPVIHRGQDLRLSKNVVMHGWCCGHKMASFYICTA